MPRRPFIAPPATVLWHLPGDPWPTIQPCDLLLVDRPTSLTDKIIRFGEWLRPLSRPYSWTAHSVFADTGNSVIQETARGSVISPLSDLNATTAAIVRIKATAAQKASALEFARWTLGSDYGWLSIVGDGLDDLTGLHISLATYGSMVCSASVARCAERMGLVPDRDPSAVQPADLARYFSLDKATMQAQFLPPPSQQKEQ